MSRQLKFRAWDKDKKWMVYDVQDAYDGLWSERNSDEVNDYYGYVSTFQSFTDEEEFNLMQYTGLKDKNGVEIYEGDIITTDLERSYLIVEYRNGAFMLNCNDGLDDYYDIFFSTSENPTEVWKYGEVIGNVYANPELLEVEDDN